ncbi:putative small GTPase superfamily, P-loop containing nucleoside triphosphate hydrolase [Rosa chinensis]|uniref:Putative small GTPase superfamily, P-loop containing nucleoside triphosphate hydrolase n=1 Tax=Rosa chinensis TaxID=74649 RepID=A0A2P6QBW1_ROSCH|nr:septum-promoting GTP-binding protein 1 [Rosa chinensis]PRQ31660.1 putative small GTPase superfamily, P-loop containing nucleoside triphosphate hydrolase [Rosa chinensis]
MARSIREAIAKMTQLVCRKIVHINFRWSVLDRVSIIREFFRFIWDKILVCSVGRQRIRYRRLTRGESSSPPPEAIEAALPTTSSYECTDEDLVRLKISLLGDCQIGKTSFMIKYVGDEQEEQRCLEMTGVSLMDKTLMVQGARISCSLWDVGGDRSSLDHVPIACKDAVAILFMFDLTSRCTLNSVVGWYSEARKWNQTAIPILIGTKFDDFVRLPPDLQWTIITQARAYAKAMKATLFFSSATHNINVNKIFKFILAKLFNLPWKVERNLNIGEPIIDY